MEIEALPITEVLVLTPRRFADERGWFCESWNARAFADAGLDVSFVQDNHSLSRHSGTIRGLHFQTPPHAQGKLVRVVRGAIRDLAVDIRHGSPTFGRHVGVDISAEDGRQVWVPPGFAHGFCTLEPDTEVLYKVTDFYDRECDKGLLFSDPELGLDWGIDAAAATLSDKDRAHPTLAELPAYFRYETPAPAGAGG